MRTRAALCLITTLGLQAAACAQSTPPPPATAIDAAQRARAGAQSTSLSPEQLAALRADAARTLESDESEIEILSSEAVTWPDGGLGCARPDEMVTQAQVPGMRILVRAKGTDRVLEYHTGRRGYFRLCPTTPVLRRPPTLPDR